MKKYINDLDERKKQLRSEIKELNKKRSDLASKKHKLMRENYMIEFDTLYGNNCQDKDVRAYNKLLKSAIASGLICIGTVFLPNGIILLTISGVVNGYLVKKTIEVKKKVEDTRNYNKILLEKKHNANKMKIDEYNSLLKQLDYAIKIKEQKIGQIDEKIFEVKNHTMPKNYYNEKAKVIEFKKTK
jgi:hypothetical protein